MFRETMEPPSPQDTDLKKIIIKLAEFVARNGPDFELMTKKKQQQNPKFGFLFGGEFYNYYKYRVALEQEVMHKQQQQHSLTGPPPPPMNMNNQMHPFMPHSPVNNNMRGLFNNLPTSGPPPSMPSSLHQPPPSNMAGPHHMSMNIPPPMAPTVCSNNNMIPANQSGLWPTNNAMNNGNMPMGPGLAVGEPNMAGHNKQQIDALGLQQSNLREQIIQSENNLQAQHSALMQQQQQKLEEAVMTAQTEYLQSTAKELNIDLSEFDKVLQPIIESCTKDSISTGKSWILQHTTDPTKCNVLLQYLLQKALTNGAAFSHKLHLIYLVNDVLHHCARKNVEDLKSGLENVVIPMFCSAQIIATSEQGLKLTKLLALWESKANFFDACVISKLQSPESSLQEYRNNLVTTHSNSNAANAIKQATKATFDNYQQQHQAFVQHATQQLATWESQRQALEQQQNIKSPIGPPIGVSNLIKQVPPAVVMAGNNNPPMGGQSTSMDQMSSMMSVNAILPNQSAMDQMAMNANNHAMEALNRPPQSNQYPIDGIMMNHKQMGAVSNSSAGNFIQAPPPPSFLIPDMSRPPPGFGASEVAIPSTPAPPEEAISSVPAVPYFELPAGLMVPLIRLEDYQYRALDANQIKLPPPTPPSDRLLAAVEAFYAPPSHDRPRDGDGWEKLALYEYYKVKNQAKKQKEDAIDQGLRSRSRSPTPIDMEMFHRPKKVNKRRYQSRSRSRSPKPAVSPPPIVHDSGRRAPQQSSSRQSNRHSRNRSPSPSNSSSSSRRNNSPRRRSDKSDREENNRYNKERSISPPSFLNYSKSTNDSIKESNKGHQMLLKMGWGGQGTGLGASAQGIDKPIDGGEVRDRKDMYKGVGLNVNDPYENFRKNKGAAFITRMKARAEDRT